MRPACTSANAPGTSVKGGSKVRAVSGIGSSILADGGANSKSATRRRRFHWKHAER
jgi:hypothetical protein